MDPAFFFFFCGVGGGTHMGFCSLGPRFFSKFVSRFFEVFAGNLREGSPVLFFVG